MPAAARRALDAVLVVVWSSPCAACGRTLRAPTRGPVCATCWTSIEPLPAASRVDQGGLVTACRAAGLYEPPLRDIVHAFKYRGHRSLAVPLARMMTAAAADVLADADIIVPVPLDPRRAWRRGFNQAADLARRLPGPGMTALRRTRFDAAQAGLGREARGRNVRGVFAPARRLRAARWLAESRWTAWVPRRLRGWVERRWSVRGKIVILVDDVRTTGATLDACARVLAAWGAREIRSVTAAQVDPRRS